jgi:homoserine kinase type II
MSAGDADLAALLSAWDLGAVHTVEPAARGTNNLTYRVNTDAGSVILRIYQNLGNLDRVAYEQELLRRLAESALPFAVPAPITSRGGATAIPARAGGRATLASLVPLISGAHPVPGDAAAARLCGRALGWLDQALAGMDPPASSSGFSTYGELERIHPLVPDPGEAAASLSVEEEARRAFVAALQRLEPAIPRLYARLPQQIIHADVARSSMLIDAGRVSGILDFEFSAPDLRVMDLAVALYQFGAVEDEMDISLEVVENLAAGYGEVIPLQANEIGAIPDLWLLRMVVSTLHRLGRVRQGVSSERDLRAHVRDTVRLDAWLEAHRDELVQRVTSAVQRQSPHAG